LDLQEKNSLKKKVDKLEMIESVYICTSFFIIVILVFLIALTLPDLLEIIEIRSSYDFASNFNKLVVVLLIYLLLLIEIIGFLTIRIYNGKQTSDA
jgi:hypothetical protein